MSQCKARYRLVEADGGRGEAYCMRDEGHEDPHTDRHGIWPLDGPYAEELRAAAERMVQTYRDWMAGCDNGAKTKDVEAAHINLRDTLAQSGHEIVHPQPGPIVDAAGLVGANTFTFSEPVDSSGGPIGADVAARQWRENAVGLVQVLAEYDAVIAAIPPEVMAKDGDEADFVIRVCDYKALRSAVVSQSSGRRNLSTESLVEWASHWVPENNRARFAECLASELRGQTVLSQCHAEASVLICPDRDGACPTAGKCHADGCQYKGPPL